MKYSLVVCLVALMFAAVVPCASAQSPELRKGVSVQMVNTQNATAMPAADNEDAWVITVTREGNLYFGADPFTADELAEWMKTHPRNREASLYIKADARAAFANVDKALELGRKAQFAAPVLLTSQTESHPPGTMVAPKGLPVWVEGPPGASSIVVEINSSEGKPSLKVNNEQTSPAALQNMLSRLLQNQSPRVVTVKAGDHATFNDFAHVIDVCTSLGAKTVVPVAEL